MVQDGRATRVRGDARPRGRPAAVVALSAVALALWAVRRAWAGPAGFSWLLWNLGLAWIPWLAARRLGAARGRASAIGWGALSLLFLPNAPYLVTDFVHLRPRPPVPLWFDALLFAGFALVGCTLGWGAMEQAHARLAREVGRRRAAIAMALLFPLVGFGVYLGRFERWNSWDLLTRPRALLVGALSAAGEPTALAFSAGFGLFLAVGYQVLFPPSRSAAASRVQE